ncbi:MAG: transketolase [Candidatus Improbicoccus devescovinae]|nr:MAG: transketolase [Candidatus Improbicoccus devescovinae]
MSKTSIKLKNINIKHTQKYDNNLEDFCYKLRKNILFAISSFGVGHIGGCLSIVELLAVLYKNYMNIDPKDPQKVDRDRLVVSKGHSGPAIYAVLCEMGFFDFKWLSTLNQPGTRLPSHCDMNKTPGIDMTTGSLGQGLSCAIGMAKASQLKKNGACIYVILGDGELQEGQVWEGAMFSAHNKLNNIIIFVDYNNAQIDGKVSEICEVEPVADKWKAFGWNVLIVKNGNSCSEINDAICKVKNDELYKNNKPCAIILYTIKGFGADFAVEAGISNHSMSYDSKMFNEYYKNI